LGFICAVFFFGICEAFLLLVIRLVLHTIDLLGFVELFCTDESFKKKLFLLKNFIEILDEK
jgi:hypothetical protein